jgi:putative ABC transport system permease protein
MLLFVLVVALASAALVGGLQGQTKAGDRWDAAFAEANGAHVTIHGDPQVLAEVAALPEVAASTHPYRTTAADLDLLVEGEAVAAAAARETSATDLPGIARPLLRDGRWVRPGADDEVVLDRAFALEEGVEVGDRIGLGTAVRARPFTVVGRAVDLVDCFYPGCEPVTTWLDPAGFDTLGGRTTTMAFLRLDDAGSAEEFAVTLGDYPIGTQGWIDTRDDTVTVYSIFGAFLGAFGIFVMVAAAVVVAGSMATRAVARRHDIGLLKAVGTTPRQVTLSIVLAHAAAAAVGVLAGWLLGGLLAPLTQVDLGDILGTGGVSFTATSLILAFVIVEALVVVATVVPAWRAGRVPTTAALASVTAAPARGRHLGRFSARLGLGPVALAGVRDAIGRPARSVLTAVALALALVAVVATLGTQRTADRLFGDPDLLGVPEELRVYPLGEGAGTIAGVLDGHEDVTSWRTETDQELSLGDEGFLGRAMDGDVARAGFEVPEGRMFTRDGEAVAGWGLINRFDLEVGDDITVEANGRPIALTIVGWYRESEDTGEMLRFPLADLQRALPGAEPDWFSVNVAEGAEPEAVATTLGRQLGPSARLEVMTTEMSDEIAAFRVAFLLVSGLVIVVALANLASTMLLAVRQRTHELGVLRAVGVTPRQVTAMVAAGAAALALAGVAVGIPLGWGVAAVVSGIVGTASGIGPGVGADPGVLTTLLLVPVAVGVAALLGALAARRAARAQVSELVRYE